MYSKNQLNNHGITATFFSELIGKKVKDFNFDNIKDGYNIHSDLYCFRLQVEGETKVRRIFAKDTYINLDVSGNHKKGALANRTEAEILEFATKCRAFTPKYFGKREFTDRKGEHTIVFMEKYDASFEKKSAELTAKKNELKKNGKQAIDDEAFEYIRRSVDVVILNDYIARRSFDPESPDSLSSKLRVKSPTFQDYRRDLESYLTGLTLYEVTSNSRKIERSEIVETSLAIMKNYIRRIEGIFDEHIIKHLVGNSGEHGLSHLDPLPCHILINDNVKLEDYEPGKIIELAHGKINGDPTPYDGFAVIDYNKFGYAPDGFGVGILLNHPSVFQMLSPEKEQELIEHAFCQNQRLKLMNADVELEDYAEEFQKFDDMVRHKAGRYALLRNIGFISWLFIKNKEKGKKLRKRNQLYDPESFIKANIERLLSLKETEFFPLNEWIEKKILPLSTKNSTIH